MCLSFCHFLILEKYQNLSADLNPNNPFKANFQLWWCIPTQYISSSKILQKSLFKSLFFTIYLAVSNYDTLDILQNVQQNALPTESATFIISNLLITFGT